MKKNPQIILDSGFTCTILLQEQCVMITKHSFKFCLGQISDGSVVASARFRVLVGSSPA